MKNKNFFLLILISFIFRILISSIGTYQLDQNTYIAWAHTIRNLGFSEYYDNAWSDYLPGFLYVLRLLTEFEKFNIPLVTLYKMPAIFVDIASIILVYKIVRKSLSEKYSLIFASLLAFNPAIFINSTNWGQVDIFSSFFPLISIFLIGNIWSAIFIGIAGLIKPQAAMAIPLIFAIMLSNRWNIKKIINYWLIVLAIFLLGFLPFSNQPNLITFIYERITATLNQYQYGSVNAFNFWGLWGFWKPDNIGFLSANRQGALIAIAFSILVFLRLVRKKINPYLSLAILFSVNFLFMTRMHERHFLPALTPLLIASSFNQNLLIVYGIFSFTYIFNLLYAYQYAGLNHNFYVPDNFVLIFITFNLISFGYLFISMYKKEKKFNLDFFKKFKIKDFNEKFTDRLDLKSSKKLLYLILIFATVSRLLFLDYPPKDYFDEIYHAFTARQILVWDSKPWHWSSAHPEGFAYEWTHPPLAKEIMAASMGFLGMNALAWRLPGAILGVGIIYLTFKIALYLTKSRDIAVLSAFILSLDGLVFTMSRIGTADVYYLFFALACFYFFLREKYLISSILFGLAIASKWSSIYLLPILFWSIVLEKKKLKISLIYFLFFPALIYLASYLPMFLHGFNFETFVGMQKQMWWYHSGLVATHPYESKWWTWPLNLRPVYFYQFDDGNLMGDIYAFGNPFFFWAGIVAFFYLIFKLIRKKASSSMALVVFGYLVFFAPWAASPRIMFLYHYLPSLPFLAIILAYFLKRKQKLLIPILTVIFLGFIYFYPHLTGIHIPREIALNYYWLKSWR